MRRKGSVASFLEALRSDGAATLAAPAFTQAFIKSIAWAWSPLAAGEAPALPLPAPAPSFPPQPGAKPAAAAPASGGKPTSAAVVLWECCPPGGLPDIVVSHRHHEVLHESVELLGHNSHRRGNDTINRHRLGSARRLLARAVIRKLTAAP